jgi:hypothetical protein
MISLAISSIILVQQQSVSVKVDSRMELIAVTSWLAGQYPAPSDSSYKLNTWKYFRAFRNHPAVQALRKSKQFYSDFTETGLDMISVENPRFKRTKRVEHWRTDVLGKDAFDAYQKHLPDFVKKTQFKKYFAQSQVDFQGGISDFQKLFSNLKVIEKLEAFYRYDKDRVRPKYEIYLEPLNGWGAHAIIDRFGDFPGDTVVRYQLGFWSDPEANLDKRLTLKDSGETRNVAWHEASHVYIDPVFNKYKAFYKTTERLFNKDMLAGQNISTWEYCLNENIVRGIVAALVRKHDGDDAGSREVSYQVDRVGFLYVGKISEWIFKEYLTTETYKNFDEYYPVLLKHIEGIPTPELISK